MNQIEHLQNVHLQCIYEEQKIHISDKIRQAGGAGEKLLYHKTTQDSCDSSMTTGFNSRFAGQNGNHSDNKVNLVLLGMSGTGKSASGNTILRKKQFLSRASSVPVTTECQEAETEINGARVCVIDTPDIFNDEIKSSVTNQHVTKCKQLLQSEPCMFLLVLHICRFTDGERDILRKFEEAFGIRAKEQKVILFTRGEDLQHADMNLEDFLQDCNTELENIVEHCGGRCVVFENKAPRQHQVTELMQTVNTMLNKYQNQ
ncbi:GTPase IMAP family member 7-like [Thunnus maccoyii]|uniref:GTPase IMAP family member 7-like n=1 Tax=Thunnus maccoyii TaxID=8240 RepID=UPI001C4A8B0F|nr:GTPase IMAP family member 7-like [Thunnus maccoyii]